MVGSSLGSCAGALRPRRALLPAGMFVCAAALASASPALAAAPPILAHATRVGAAPTLQPLQLVLPLKVDAAGLKRFASAVSTPGSPLYGRYLSIPALAGRFGASARTRARAIGYLRASGATHVRVDATGLLAQATMTVGLAERVFTAAIGRFYTADRRSFVAPVAATSVPASLRGVVEGVVGLDTQPLASAGTTSAAAARGAAAAGASRNSPVTARAAQQTSSTLPRSGTPAGCPEGQAAGGPYPGFTPNQYLTAYGFDPLYSAGFMGQGIRVALIEIDGFNMSDITMFAQCFGLNLPPISAFGAGVSHSLPPGEEATLDLEILAAAAPHLKAIDVYETDSGAAHTLLAFAAPLQNRGRVPQVISASLGLCEPEAFAASGIAGIRASEELLQLGAAAGVSIVASSGDNGSADCQSQAGTPVDTLAVNYPASSWWVTGVGGTNLSLNADNTIAAQPVWNDSSLVAAGGGGGFSALSRPPYQSGVVPGKHRAVPDVSMLADLLPGYAIYCTTTPDCINQNNGAPWQTVGGTSAGTPLLAGGIAIVDQMLAASHHESLGLLNPLLYKVGASSAASSVFYDVTSGDNDIGPFIPGGTGQPLGCCTATPGYDEASGWGSVVMANLAQEALALVPKKISFSLALPRGQRPVAHRELLATVSCSAACSIAAFAEIKVGRSKPFLAHTNIFHRPAKGRKTVHVKFSGRQARLLRFALSHHRKIVATVFGALIDSLGDIQHNTAGKQLRITA